MRVTVAAAGLAGTGNRGDLRCVRAGQAPMKVTQFDVTITSRTTTSASLAIRTTTYIEMSMYTTHAGSSAWRNEPTHEYMSSRGYLWLIREPRGYLANKFIQYFVFLFDRV